MKNSFILHIDSLCILEKMTDEIAGQFIKIIYQYQKTRELPQMDFTMEMIVTPFINQFFRDEKGYERVVSRNKENGAKGGRPSKEPKKPNGLIKTQDNPKNPSEPKKADSDSDSVNDSDSGSDNEKEENKIKYRKNIKLTEPENSSLIHLYGESFTNSCYDYLSDYKIEKGYKTKSDYRTIIRWVVDAVKKKGIKADNVISMTGRKYDPTDRSNYWNDADYEAAMKKLNENAAS
jgi:hypothetical protein